jgi:hypothetical protein
VAVTLASSVTVSAKTPTVQVCIYIYHFSSTACCKYNSFVLHLAACLPVVIFSLSGDVACDARETVLLHSAVLIGASFDLRREYSFPFLHVNYAFGLLLRTRVTSCLILYSFCLV